MTPQPRPEQGFTREDLRKDTYRPQGEKVDVERLRVDYWAERKLREDVEAELEAARSREKAYRTGLEAAREHSENQRKALDKLQRKYNTVKGQLATTQASGEAVE